MEYLMGRQYWKTLCSRFKDGQYKELTETYFSDTPSMQNKLQSVCMTLYMRATPKLYCRYVQAYLKVRNEITYRKCVSITGGNGSCFSCPG